MCPRVFAFGKIYVATQLSSSPTRDKSRANCARCHNWTEEHIPSSCGNITWMDYFLSLRFQHLDRRLLHSRTAILRAQKTSKQRKPKFRRRGRISERRSVTIHQYIFLWHSVSVLWSSQKWKWNDLFQFPFSFSIVLSKRKKRRKL